MKNLIKKVFNNVGIEITRYHPSSSTAAQLAKALETSNINLIFDIGANKGQFARQTRNHGYKGKIVSFEPLSNARQDLMSFSARDKDWEVHEQSAVGDYNGKIKINIAGNSVSSSVLPMLESHARAAPCSEYVGSEEVSIARLDSIAPRYLRPESNLFIKIDAQGFEWQVLDGAPETLSKAQGVLSEISLIPLYDGQMMWRDIVDRLDANGFGLWALQQGFLSPLTGQSLQMDAIFLRKDIFKA